jgi:hypothetical protein
MPALERIPRVLDALTPEKVRWRSLAWSIVPGLGQIREGRRRLGRVLLAAWVGLFALGLLSLGTALQPVFFMFMLAVHGFAVSIVFAANLCWERLIIRLLFGLLIFAVLYYALYRPIGTLVERFGRVQRIGGFVRVGPIEDGDALLVAGPWLSSGPLRRGDLVLYRVRGFGGGGAYIRPGYGLDRVVGVEGDRVVLRKGELLVNGVPPAAENRPLAAPPAGLELDRVLEFGEYAIVPSQLQITFPQQAHGRVYFPPEAMVIGENEILGRVLWRIRPLKRWGPVE